MQIYNTMTRKKETFVPLREGYVSMYVCGPTVYDYIHIGNARPLIVFDTFRRYLEYRGYQVTYVQNFTDIDDKLINRAASENTNVPALAERFIKEYYTDADALGIQRSTANPRATEHIDDIINLVQTLIDKGHAYAVENGDVYFSVRSYPLPLCAKHPLEVFQQPGFCRLLQFSNFSDRFRRPSIDACTLLPYTA